MFPSPFIVLFWVCFAGAAYSAVQMSLSDRRMQGFRDPRASRSAFLLVPWRWQDDFYTAEGRPLVAKAWQWFRRMLGFFVLGVLFGLLGY
jgi:hypothetical protein